MLLFWCMPRTLVPHGSFAAKERPSPLARAIAGVLTPFSLVILLLASGPAAAQELLGRVVSVHDGDTLTVLDATHVQYRIRLTGIDAPESHQPYGQASRKHLAERVAGKDVTIHWQKRDKYRRLLGRVEFEGGDMNLEQLRAGYAWHYLRYAAGQPSQERADYAQAEGQARRERVGLWQDSRPMPPWDYRHRPRRAP